MHFPHALPPRVTDLATDDASALVAAQPERRREYVQIASGAFRAELRERLHGGAGLLHERWSCGLRVRCDRPRGYVAFSSLTSLGPATCVGVALDGDAVLQLDREWELALGASADSVSFAVETESLLRAETALAGCDAGPGAMGNRVLRGPERAGAALALRGQVAKSLAAGALPSAARDALVADLLHLAVRLRRWGSAAAQPESASRRRRAVRRVEEFLSAHPFALLSLAELCTLAGVGERTLEYAFREHVGLTPARYLRIRRLNGVRRELRDGNLDEQRVTDVAMRWGFWELGRFASEYRALFDELPSHTLAARMRRAPVAATPAAR